VKASPVQRGPSPGGRPVAAAGAVAGFAYAPQLADLPDQKMWRIDRAADYGAFQNVARGRIDLARIERH
jgi:TnpA family transposase